jgi:alcohol dehydrogenase class IV
MVNSFDFGTAGHVLFGNGRAGELAGIARAFGQRALVVTGSRSARAQHLLDSLGEQSIATLLFSVPGEPDLASVQSGAALVRANQYELVISIGGGSVIDAGKAIAALATNQGDLFDYLEVIGQAQPLTEAPLPFIAVPTTAGTGSEMTRNAVLRSPEHRVKVSLRSPLMLPRVALVDPELTHALPPRLTASTGMDALTQLIEPFVSQFANPLTDGLCREALPRVGRSLHRAFENGADADARSDMALASLFGGIALANSGLGAVHGFAAPIGGMYSAPHGAVCASLLPDVMEKNIRAAQEQKALEITRRYNEVARLVTGVTTARAADGVQWVRELARQLHVPRLSTLGIQRENFAEIAEKAADSSSMKGNPIELTADQLVEILEHAF